MRNWILLAVAGAVYAMPTLAQTEVLLQATTSWNGGALAYPAGEPEITAVRITLDAGEQTPFHCHPVPVLGYILSGTLEVDTQSGEKITLEAGSAAVEVMNTIHRGTAIGGPVEILVLYAGAVGTDNTLKTSDGRCSVD